MVVSASFQPGALYQTSRVWDACVEHAPFFRFVQQSFRRHCRGDWGDCCPDDAALNDTALQDGGRIFSVYHIPPTLYALESSIWIITESDRSYTTILFPSDY